MRRAVEGRRRLVYIVSLSVALLLFVIFGSQSFLVVRPSLKVNLRQPL